MFNADPTVGGRYSALTAFGLVPSGLAGADIDEILDEAETIELSLAIDSPRTPGSCSAPRSRPRHRCATSSRSSPTAHIVGFADWAEQLIAESTGKEGTGILPVVLEKDAPELSADLADLQVVRLVDDAGDQIFSHHDTGEIRVSGSLGAQLLVWEYATAVAGRLLGINPFDQPDVESAKIAARGLLDARPEPAPAAFVADGIEVRGTPDVIGAASDLVSAIDVLLEELPANGYISVQAYVDRVARRARAPPRPARGAYRPTRHLRLGPALPALDRPVPQGRTGGRRVPADPESRRRTSRSPTVRSRSASSSPRRRPATRACSPTTAGPC